MRIFEDSMIISTLTHHLITENQNLVRKILDVGNPNFPRHGGYRVPQQEGIASASEGAWCQGKPGTICRRPVAARPSLLLSPRTPQFSLPCKKSAAIIEALRALMQPEAVAAVEEEAMAEETPAADLPMAASDDQEEEEEVAPPPAPTKEEEEEQMEVEEEQQPAPPAVDSAPVVEEEAQEQQEEVAPVLNDVSELMQDEETALALEPQPEPVHDEQEQQQQEGEHVEEDKDTAMDEDVVVKVVEEVKVEQTDSSEVAVSSSSSSSSAAPAVADVASESAAPGVQAAGQTKLKVDPVRSDNLRCMLLQSTK
jgi:hypothetical protein